MPEYSETAGGEYQINVRHVRWIQMLLPQRNVFRWVSVLPAAGGELQPAVPLYMHEAEQSEFAFEGEGYGGDAAETMQRGRVLQQSGDAADPVSLALLTHLYCH
ncbi:hypothetical protein F2P81_009928 [Scophthalmus maximus]|uniref:Uncharacterized protein n=1 Tax=Scophthalmus maximus TaxID=52904 RepID=A0A6A4T1C3_SCOMX|nr:hypothetical protein F2P81_009928 [Scophthalmus maximus]